jgi:crotonobetainyl-CoA:carnitine CoA-transferase CaiB-like acyl-CoA transferase
MVGSILAALRLAESTGETQVVDVSLLGTSLWSMAVNIAPSLIDGRSPRARDRHEELNPLVNRYPCADDGWILLTMPEGRWWPRFCEAIGQPGWADDPDYDSPKKRYDRMAEIVARIDAITVTKTAAEWGRIFDEAGLIWGPIQTISEVVADPQARSQDMFVAQDFPDGRGSFDTVAIPHRIAGADIGPRGTAPGLGAHTAEVLKGLGVDDDELARLVADGVINEG